MKKKIFFILSVFFVLLFSALSSVANNSNDKRYHYIHFLVKNKTDYPVALTIVFTDGTWEKPVSLNTPMLLNANDSYQNTLISLQNGDDFKSFASMSAAQIGDERNNYVIFAEKGDSQEKSLSEHIFDGMGKIFVGSVANHCVDDTPQGYADCGLILKEGGGA